MNPSPTAASLDLKSKAMGMRRALPQARHLPSDFYASPDIEAMEKTSIFLTQWLCLGREEEVPHVGDYMALRIVGEPLIVVRDKDDSIAVLRNQCLHRGVEIAFGKGSARSFNCPYHAWGYDLGGRLLAAPYMKQSEADLGDCALPRLRSARWRGWIFATFNDNPSAFEAFIAPYAQALWFYRTEECLLADKMVLEVQCNWKFVAENLLDRYHTGTLHAKTFGKYLKSNRDEFDFTRIPGGGCCFISQSAPMDPDGNQTFAPMPWLLEHGVGFAAKASIFPNMNLSTRSDSIRMWVLWPLSTGRTQISSYLLFHKSAFADPQFERKLGNYRDYLKTIVAEDQTAVESLQRVADSYRYEPGPLSHLEGPIHHLLNHYLDTIGA
jgi:choline monooxygenase